MRTINQRVFSGGGFYRWVFFPALFLFPVGFLFRSGFFPVGFFCGRFFFHLVFFSWFVTQINGVQFGGAEIHIGRGPSRGGPDREGHNMACLLDYRPFTAAGCAIIRSYWITSHSFGRWIGLPSIGNCCVACYRRSLMGPLSCALH